MEQEKVFAMKLSKIYPLLTAKAEAKGRTRQEVDEVICWLTGYDRAGLERQLSLDIDYGTFFPGSAPDEPQLREDHRDRLRRPGGGDRGPTDAEDPVFGQADRRAGKGKAAGEGPSEIETLCDVCRGAAPTGRLRGAALLYRI